MRVEARISMSFPVVALRVCRSRGASMEIVSGALCLGSGGEDRPTVSFQLVQPACQIGSMVLTYLRSDTQVGAQEGGSHFRDQFLSRIGVTAKTFAEFTRQA